MNKGLLFLIYPAMADMISRKIDLRIMTVIWGILLIMPIFGEDLPISVRLMGVIPGGMLLLLSFFLPDEIGKGDGLVMMGYGLLEGLVAVLTLSLTGLFLAGVTGLLLILFRRADQKSKLPFVSFLMAAALIQWLLYK